MEYDENNRDVSDDAADVSPAAEAVAGEGDEVTTRDEVDPDLAEAGVAARSRSARAAETPSAPPPAGQRTAGGARALAPASLVGRSAPWAFSCPACAPRSRRT